MTTSESGQAGAESAPAARTTPRPRRVSLSSQSAVPGARSVRYRGGRRAGPERPAVQVPLNWARRSCGRQRLPGGVLVFRFLGRGPAHRGAGMTAHPITRLGAGRALHRRRRRPGRRHARPWEVDAVRTAFLEQVVRDCDVLAVDEGPRRGRRPGPLPRPDAAAPPSRPRGRSDRPPSDGRSPPSGGGHGTHRSRVRRHRALGPGRGGCERPGARARRGHRQPRDDHGQVHGHPGETASSSTWRAGASPPTRPTAPNSSCNSPTTSPPTSWSPPSTATARIRRIFLEGILGVASVSSPSNWLTCARS